MLYEKYFEIRLYDVSKRKINRAMALAFDPYKVFKSRKTPAGLYARQKWLAEFDDRQWKKDFDEMVAKLVADQNQDGSWGETGAEWNTFLVIHAMRNKGLI